VFEVLLGESIEVRPGTTITQKSGDPAEIVGAKITPSALGLSRFVLEGFDGTLVELRVFVFERGCLDYIDGSKSRHHNGGTHAHARHVLRSIVNDGLPAWFVGTAESLANAPSGLAVYGVGGHQEASDNYANPHA
jgi:hypothetical protein